MAFAKMSFAGFGGVLVWARRGIVDQHRWMTADEFNETFTPCHFLPGPNIVNLSVVFGWRIRGIAGGTAVLAGLLAPPMLIMMLLAGGLLGFAGVIWRKSLGRTAGAGALSEQNGRKAQCWGRVR
jgi:chromate transporter